MTRAQKAVPIAVLIVLFLAVGWSLLPFTFANTIDCSPPLFGAKPHQLTAPPEGFINPVIDCKATGKSRLSVSAIAAFVAVLAGTLALYFKPVSGSCLAGNHDDCREWWPSVMGGAAESFACQCPCHEGVW